MSLPKLPSDASDVEETDQFFDAPLNVLMEIPRCPKGMEWHYRPLSLCGDKMKYTCLNISYPDMNMKGETCGGPRVEISGSKAVLNNYYFDNMICSSERYQPINFNSIGRSDCELLKSLCSEIGSIVSKVGSSSVDTSCRCNYIESFAPVMPVGLRDIHDCKPGRFEDCSCYLVECLPGEILSPEYKCIRDDLLTAVFSAQGVTSTTRTNPVETLFDIASDNNDQAYNGISIEDVLTAVGQGVNDTTYTNPFETTFDIASDNNDQAYNGISIDDVLTAVGQGVNDTTYTDPFETTFDIASDNNDQASNGISIEDVLTAVGQGVTDTTYTDPFETTFDIASDNNDQGGIEWVPKILIIAVLGGLLFYGVRSVIKKRRQQLALQDVPAEDGFNQTE